MLEDTLTLRLRKKKIIIHTCDQSLAFCVTVVMLRSIHHKAPMKAPMLTPPTMSMGMPASYKGTHRETTIYFQMTIHKYKQKKGKLLFNYLNTVKILMKFFDTGVCVCM